MAGGLTHDVELLRFLHQLEPLHFLPQLEDVMRAPRTLTEKEYKALAGLNSKMDGSLATILNRNDGVDLTCCPRCRVDDFGHADGCALLDSGDPGDRTEPKP